MASLPGLGFSGMGRLRARRTISLAGLHANRIAQARLCYNKGQVSTKGRTICGDLARQTCLRWGLLMAVIVLRLDEFNATPDNRPKFCPYCGCEFLQSWGKGAHAVQDVEPEVGEYHRFRCSACGRTFRRYSGGSDRTGLTPRMRKIAGMAWALGLSAREVVDVLGEAGIELNYMTVWREGTELVTRLKEYFGPERPGRYSIDKQFLKIKTRNIGTSIMIEMGGGKTVVLGRMDEVDYRKVLAWLDPILKDLQLTVSITGTDMLFNMDRD